MTDLDDLRVLTEPTEERLNERQLVDYRSQREKCLRWLLARGKDPETFDGYAFQTVRARGCRMDYFYRWVWDEKGRYVSDLTHAHADEFLQQLADEDRSNADRGTTRRRSRCCSALLDEKCARMTARDRLARRVAGVRRRCLIGGQTRAANRPGGSAGHPTRPGRASLCTRPSVRWRRGAAADCVRASPRGRHARLSLS